MFGHKKTLRIPSFQSPHAAVAPAQPPQNRQDERKARLKGPAGIWDEFHARPQEPAPTIDNSLFTKSKSAAPLASTSTLARSTTKEKNPFSVEPIESETKHILPRIRSASFRPSVGPTHAEIAGADINADSHLKAFLGRGNSAELVMTEWSKKKGKEKSTTGVRSVNKEYSPRRSRSRSIRPEPIPEAIEEATIARISPSDISTPATANATTAATTISPPRHAKSTIKAGKKRAIAEVEQPIHLPPPAKSAPTKRKSKSASVVPDVISVVEKEKGTKGKRAISQVDAETEIVAPAVAKKPRATKAKKLLAVSTEEEEWARVSGLKEMSSKQGKEKAVEMEVEPGAPPKKKVATKKNTTKQVEPVVEAQEDSIIVVEQPIVKQKARKKTKPAVVLATTPPAKSGKRKVDLAESEDHSPIARKQKSKSTNAAASSSKVTLGVQASPKKVSKVAKVVGKKVARVESSPRQSVTKPASPKAKPSAKVKSSSKSKSAATTQSTVDAPPEQVAEGGYDFEEERLVSNQGKLNLMDLLGAGIAEMLRQELEMVAPGAATTSLELYRDRVRLFFLTQSDRLSALTAVAAKVNSARSKAKLLRAQLEGQ